MAAYGQMTLRTGQKAQSLKFQGTPPPSAWSIYLASFTDDADRVVRRSNNLRWHGTGGASNGRTLRWHQERQGSPGGSANVSAILSPPDGYCTLRVCIPVVFDIKGVSRGVRLRKALPRSSNSSCVIFGARGYLQNVPLFAREVLRQPALR